MRERHLAMQRACYTSRGAVDLAAADGVTLFFDAHQSGDQPVAAAMASLGPIGASGRTVFPGPALRGLALDTGLSLVRHRLAGRT